MGTIYIGSGQKNKNNSGLKWKVFIFLSLFLAVVCTVLKLTAPMIVEKWINQQGGDSQGYAFSIRDVELSFNKRQLILSDVKIFNRDTKSELLEAPNLTLQLNWDDLVLSQERKISVYADKADLILSKDFSSELERIKVADKKEKRDFYLNAVEANIGQLNIIEQKEDKSRTVLELRDVNVKVSEFSLLSINKKTEFTVSSNITDGGKLNLKGKTKEENGKTPWIIQGSLNQVSADFLNQIAGDKLPFDFRESRLNAEITAHSESGKVTGEITPDIKILNLVEEKPGIPTQTIARALTDELTFSLPFTLKDGLTLQYEGTFSKLKNYRRGPATADTTVQVKSPVAQNAKASKTKSFWPF